MVALATKADLVREDIGPGAPWDAREELRKARLPAWLADPHGHTENCAVNNYRK